MQIHVEFLVLKSSSVVRVTRKGSAFESRSFLSFLFPSFSSNAVFFSLKLLNKSGHVVFKLHY